MIPPARSPAEGTWSQGGQDLSKGCHTDPSHGDINTGGKPLGTADPQGVDQDAHGCNGPHQGQEPVSGRISQNDEAYRRIRSCDRTKIII